MIRWVVAIALVFAVAPAVSAEFAAAVGHKGYGRCHMDTCGFFIIDAAVPVGSGKDGTLYAISEHDWEAAYNSTGGDDEYERPPISVSKAQPRLSLVYCSKTRPIVFDYSDNQWHSASLRPGDEGAIFGAAESAYQYYFAACHDVIVHEPNPKGLAKRLGYKFEQSEAGSMNISFLQPQDLLLQK